MRIRRHQDSPALLPLWTCHPAGFHISGAFQAQCSPRLRLGTGGGENTQEKDACAPQPCPGRHTRQLRTGYVWTVQGWARSARWACRRTDYRPHALCLMLFPRGVPGGGESYLRRDINAESSRFRYRSGAAVPDSPCSGDSSASRGLQKCPVPAIYPEYTVQQALTAHGTTTRPGPQANSRGPLYAWQVGTRICLQHCSSSFATHSAAIEAGVTQKSASSNPGKSSPAINQIDNINRLIRCPGWTISRQSWNAARHTMVKR